MDLLLEPGNRGQPRRRGRRAVQPRGNAVVGKLRLIAHNRPIDLGLGWGPIGADPQLDDKGQAHLALPQGCQVRREFLGKHGEDSGGRVHGGRVATSMAVDGGAHLHHGVDIGDGNEDRRQTARPRFRSGELIQIARVVIVDRAPEQTTQVAD